MGRRGQAAWYGLSVQICVCDAGLGNLRSVERALCRAASGARPASVVLSRDPEVVARADKIVVPGQGGFGDCAAAMGRGLGEAIRAQIVRGTPYLGICLGLQILFEGSAEAPGAAGLGVLAGEVVRLPGGTDPLTSSPLKIPHTGWNVVRDAGTSPWLGRPEQHYYFVHSYAVVPRDPRIIAATTDYGADFVSAVVRENVFACQFHPEKSQGAGLALLERFVAS